MKISKNIIYLAIAIFVWKVSIPSLIHLYNHGLLSGYKPEESSIYEMHNLVFAFVLSCIAMFTIIHFFKGNFDNNLDQLKTWLNRRNEPKKKYLKL